MVHARQLLALGALWLLPIVSIGAPAQAAALYSFDLPEQALADSLRSIARQTATNILFDADSVENLTAPAVHGKLSVANAVYRVLATTKLHAKQTDANTLIVQLVADSTMLNSQRRLWDATDVAAVAGRESGSAAGGNYGIVRVAQNSKNQTVTNEADNQKTKASVSSGDESTNTNLDEIVVTGTLLRGIKPAGANVISLDSGDIAATGASNANEVLQNIPQLATFGNTNQQITTVNFQVTVDRPNIRNLPGAGTSGGSTTLVLVDGHRLVGAGIKETAPDPNVVPPGILERVEILPDGGSAIYGSDAIGGVINFITKRHFDGIEVDGRYGFADNYTTYDVNAMLGHDWASGSVYLAYSHSENSPLFAYDRSYARQYTPSGGANPDVTCVPGNVIVTAGASQTTYAMPGLQPNTANNCDNTRFSTIFSGDVRNHVYAGLAQDFNDGGIKLDIRSYYASQTTKNYGNLTSTGTITAANPFYQRTADNPAPAPPNIELAAFSWAPVLGDRSSQLSTTISSWGATPTISFDLGNSGWQLRGMYNYGGSTTLVDNRQINPTALTQALGATTTGTALNPYDLTATNPSVISNIDNYELYGKSDQRLSDGRLVADGPLFTLPGGAVHLATGFEYMHESYIAKQGNFVPGTEGTVPYTEASRDSYAVFAEMNVPLVGKPNEMTGIKSLSVNVSGRYDHYSDFGGTTNPKVALNYEPIDWIKFRANWGTSFNAPSLADTAAVDNGLFVAPALVFPSVLPGQFSPSQAFDPLVFIQGGLPNLKPQTGRTYEIGTDISPPIAPGLKFSLTYYHIDFNDIISTPNVSSPINFWTYYKSSYVLSPTNAQVLAFASQIPGGLAQVVPLLAPGSLPVYAIIDDRRQNLGNAKITGLDIALDYVHATGFGSFDVTFNGNYDLTSKTQPLAGLPYVDNLAVDNSRYRFSAAAGANVGALRAQAILNYVAGFDVTATPVNNNQSHVDAFTVVNLFFRYDLSGLDFKALTNNLALSLSINNVFDVDPPLYQGTYNTLYNGYANGSTVGRLIQVGFSKKF
jgi:iron complex outermembrane recepter protein